jgi:hypothetical protein
VCEGTITSTCDVVDLLNSCYELNWTIDVALQPATPYWWQVRAVNYIGREQARRGQYW